MNGVVPFHENYKRVDNIIKEAVKHETYKAELNTSLENTLPSQRYEVNYPVDSGNMSTKEDIPTKNQIKKVSLKELFM